jgi:YHS domain-containing protein
MKHLILLSSVLLFCLSDSQAQIGARQDNFNLEKGMVALQGYDPVSYFTQNKAVKGKKEIHLNVMGINYWFASDANRKTFMKDYKKYEPQYGGWCAYAMGKTGEKVEVDPETFKIKDGKLYLFYHSFTNNTLPKWNAEEAGLKAKADKNWAATFK